jgi:chromosome segregation ATPase
MKNAWVLVFLMLGFMGTESLWPQSPKSPPSGQNLTSSDDDWQGVVRQFEESVLSLSDELSTLKTQKKSLDQGIDKLKEKIKKLRQDAQGQTNVFDEIRLKNFLNDLKDMLEKSSTLQRDLDDKQKGFEQKSLVLLALYNDRIDKDLAADAASQDSSLLSSKLRDLAFLVQKRHYLQSLLTKYQTNDSVEEPIHEPSLDDLNLGDQESLQLTLDLIRDRKNDLESQQEKYSIEEDEIKKELNLQGKMQEFLEGVQKLNEDSNFPHGSLKRNDLEDMAGTKEKHKLEKRLNELQGMTDQCQKSLEQLNQLMTNVQNHLNSLSDKDTK